MEKKHKEKESSNILFEILEELINSWKKMTKFFFFLDNSGYLLNLYENADLV